MVSARFPHIWLLTRDILDIDRLNPRIYPGILYPALVSVAGVVARNQPRFSMAAQDRQDLRSNDLVARGNAASPGSPPVHASAVTLSRHLPQRRQRGICGITARGGGRLRVPADPDHENRSIVIIHSV